MPISVHVTLPVLVPMQLFYTIAAMYTIRVLALSCVSRWAGVARDLTFCVLITTNITLTTVFCGCVQEKPGGTSNYAIKEKNQHVNTDVQL